MNIYQTLTDRRLSSSHPDEKRVWANPHQLGGSQACLWDLFRAGLNNQFSILHIWPQKNGYVSSRYTEVHLHVLQHMFTPPLHLLGYSFHFPFVMSKRNRESWGRICWHVSCTLKTKPYFVLPVCPLTWKSVLAASRTSFILQPSLEARSSHPSFLSPSLFSRNCWFNEGPCGQHYSHW